MTHTCFDSALAKIGGKYRIDELSEYFSLLNSSLEYSHWYFRHMHWDFNINDKVNCIYREIIELQF